MALVPSDCICSYNGFTFDPLTALTTGLSVTPVEDATGRTVAYNKIYLKVRCEVIGQPTDAAVLGARQKLTKYGGVLVYSGRGIGPLSINTGRVRDIKFGPKPRVLSITPLGYKNACTIEWEVDVHIPECPDAKYSLGFLELSYKMEFHIQPNGRVNQTVSGELKIPNNRTLPGSDSVLDSPDLYREKIAPPVPYWFHREWQPWRIDTARTSLGFGWTDKEFGKNVFPPGIVNIDASNSARQRKEGAALVQMVGTIRARITLAADADTSMAEKAFFYIVKKRFSDRKKAKYKGNRGVTVGYVPMSYEFTEPDIFGQDTVCEFSMSYLITGTSLDTYLRDTGLWEPIYGEQTDWSKWYGTVQNSAMGAYGLSRITFTPNADQIVDLCQNSPDGLRPIGAAKPVTRDQLGEFGFPPIDEAGSWLKYSCFLRIESDAGTVEIQELATKAMPTPPTSSTPAVLLPPSTTPTEIAPAPRPVAHDWAGFAIIAGLGGQPVGGTQGGGSQGGSTSGSGGSGGAGNPVLPPTPTSPSVSADSTWIQRRTSPMTVIYLYGEALRVGFEIPPPSLGDVGGVKPVISNRVDKGEGFSTGQVDMTATGVPIYGAKWRLRYVLPQNPAGPVVPPDPASWLGRRLG